MPAGKSNVYLIGPMGSGKTTIGKHTAELLGLSFLDCDTELESRTGASVNLIFDIEGEEGFRERETRLLEEVSKWRRCLIATGGGSVLREENRRIMKHTGIVVYLETSVPQQLKRLRMDKKRPLLQTRDREKKLITLAEKRNPLYRELADIVFPTRNRSIHLSAERLSQAILSYWGENLQPGKTGP